MWSTVRSYVVGCWIGIQVMVFLVTVSWYRDGICHVVHTTQQIFGCVKLSGRVHLMPLKFILHI